MAVKSRLEDWDSFIGILSTEGQIHYETFLLHRFFFLLIESRDF